MDMSEALRDALRDHLFRSATFAKPAALWVGLHTGDPGVAGTANEVSGGGYARTQLDPSDSNWTDEATAGESANAVTITFPAPSGADWGSITHVSIWDAASGGTFLFADALATPKTVNDGDPAPKFAAGDLVVGFKEEV